MLSPKLPHLRVFVLLLCALKSLSAEWLCDCILAAIKRPLLPRRRREQNSADTVVLHLVRLSVCVCTSCWGGLLLRCASQELKMCSIPKSLHLLCVLAHCSGMRKLGLGNQRKLGNLRQQFYIYAAHVK